MLRFRSIVPAALLLLFIAGMFAVAPAASPAWLRVSAQSAPKAAPGDRFFLKIDGIVGEVTEADHVGDLALRSFTWSAFRTDTSAKVQTKDFHAVMAFDTASPLLMRKTAIRERIAKAVLTARNPLGQDYLKWTMTDVILTSVQLDGTAGQGKPLVTFDMNVAKIDVEYRPQFTNGGLGPAAKTGWETR